MNFLALFFILMPAASDAAMRPFSWMDVQESKAVELSQALKLGEGSFAEGTALAMIRAEALSAPGMALTYYTLKEINCTHPQWESDLQIILPEGVTDESHSVGVELKPGCEWGIYVEVKDLSFPSFFRPGA
jgi:hypothetical protein